MLKLTTVNIRPEDVTPERIAQFQGSDIIIPLSRAIGTSSYSGVPTPPEGEVLRLNIGAFVRPSVLGPELEAIVEDSLEKHAAIWAKLAEY
jgi:hypothetical protein